MWRERVCGSRAYRRAAKNRAIRAAFWAAASSPRRGTCVAVQQDDNAPTHERRLNPREDIMKYGLALLLGIPVPIVAIWFLAQHC
jgi:hypothetical protein